MIRPVVHPRWRERAEAHLGLALAIADWSRRRWGDRVDAGGVAVDALLDVARDGAIDDAAVPGRLRLAFRAEVARLAKLSGSRWRLLARSGLRPDCSHSAIEAERRGRARQRMADLVGAAVDALPNPHRSVIAYLHGLRGRHRLSPEAYARMRGPSWSGDRVLRVEGEALALLRAALEPPAWDEDEDEDEDERRSA